jgi:hypothetical protein
VRSAYGEPMEKCGAYRDKGKTSVAPQRQLGLLPAAALVPAAARSDIQELFLHEVPGGGAYEEGTPHKPRPSTMSAHASDSSPTVLPKEN